MTGVPFQNVPSNLRIPLFYAEVNNSNANTAQQLQNSLLIGQMFTTGASAGTATPGIPVVCGGVAHAAQLAGPGSMLHLMAQAYFANDPAGSVYLLPLADAAGAVAAAGSLNFTAAATQNGVLSLYIAGQLISLPVLSTQTVDQLATALAAAVNATPNLPVSALVSGPTPSEVNFTALNAGPGGNDIDIRVNYGGTAAQQATPAGLTFAITAMSGGATPPTLTSGLANLGDQPFDFIVCPYTDSISLGALQTLLSDVSGRWSWQNQVYGHVFAALRGTYGALTTFGATQDNQHTSVMGFYDSPSPNWVWAAAVAGAAAPSLRNFAPQPLQTLQIAGVLAPPLASRFMLTERNNLLYGGVSTFSVADDGTVSIERLITTYQTNTYGQPDNSYLPVERMFTLMYVLRFMKTRITSKFGRCALVDDGTRFATGLPIVSPSILRADQIAAYGELENAGYVQDAQAFAAGLIVQRNLQNGQGDPSRVDVLWAGSLTDQLNIFAFLAMFQTATGS